MTKVVVNSRERTLLSIFRAQSDGFDVAPLPVGDVHVEYADGKSWVCERKTAADLAASLLDGCWKEQTSRLFSCSTKAYIIIEGDLRNADGMYKHVFGAWLNMSLRGVDVLRTWDANETFATLASMIEKLEHWVPGAPPRNDGGLSIPKLKGKMTSKRARDANAVETRQLMCIPSISENIARKLLQHFGTMSRLRVALSDLASFPVVQLNGKTKLGRARLRHLTRHLLGEDKPASRPKRAKTKIQIKVCKCVEQVRLHVPNSTLDGCVRVQAH